MTAKPSVLHQVRDSSIDWRVFVMVRLPWAVEEGRKVVPELKMTVAVESQEMEVVVLMAPVRKRMVAFRVARMVVREYVPPVLLVAPFSMVVG